jgi:hypothetical protein
LCALIIGIKFAVWFCMNIGGIWSGILDEFYDLGGRTLVNLECAYHLDIETGVG